MAIFLTDLKEIFFVSHSGTERAKLVCYYALVTDDGCCLSRPYWKVVILIGGLATYYIAYERLGILIVLTFSISRSQKVISSLTTGSVTWCKYLQTNSARSRYFISWFYHLYTRCDICIESYGEMKLLFIIRNFITLKELLQITFQILNSSNLLELVPRFRYQYQSIIILIILCSVPEKKDEVILCRIILFSVKPCTINIM